MLSIERAYKRALKAAKKRPRKPPPALTRYGYLVVNWPLVEDELPESGGGAYMLGEAEDLTITRSETKESKEAMKSNLDRLAADAKRILGPQYHIVEHNGYLFLQTR